MRKFLFGLLALAALASASAQVQVDISFKRTLYLRYEPLICTVSITNNSGRALELADTPRNKWFGFEIESGDNRPLPPVDVSYRNEPVQIEAGQKLTRSVNLTPLFPMSEFGTYRVRAAVYSSQLEKYFSSEALNVEITEGRDVWHETVGVPPGAGQGNTRVFTLLSHRLPQTTVLYLRVEDREAGVVYCTLPLGRFVAFGNPEVQFDTKNNINVLQNTAPKNFLHSVFDINGKLVKQQAYNAPNAKPILVRQTDGTFAVAGGVPYDPKATPPEKLLPKLSDRPVALPTPQGKATPEDKRPESLLSR